jgi:hypothetical protein
MATKQRKLSKIKLSSDTISRLTRKPSNTDVNIVNDKKNKYKLIVYLLNGFKIKVYDSKYIIKIRVGTEKDECITLTITKDDDQNNYNAELERFNYQSGCTIHANMERSKDTKLMMKTLIKFIKSKYPNITHIMLLDATKYDCNKLSTYKNYFSLYDYYLFKYGSTYYIHNFGAEMTSQCDIDDHENNKKIIKGFAINKILLEKYLNKLIGKIKVPNIKEDIQEFINAIADNELATNFIKRYRFNDNTCYLMHFLFEFIKKSILINVIKQSIKNNTNHNNANNANSGNTNENTDVIDINIYQTLHPYCSITI